MKACPYCAEQIQDAAIVCRFCGKDLVESTEQTPEKKKSSSGVLILAILFFIGLLWIIGGDNGSSDPTALPSTSPRTTYSVTYKVGGSATRASLTYQNSQGNTEQIDVRVPWTKKFTVSDGTFLYLSAQNLREYGRITCDILVDDKSIEHAESDGGYKIATCSGSVP